MNSSKITKDQVKHVAKLAGLTLTEQEVNTFQAQLSDILAYIDQLQKIDTKNVELTSQVTGLKNVLRADEIKKDRIFNQKQALQNAKKTHKGYFAVPAVIEKE